MSARVLDGVVPRRWPDVAAVVEEGWHPGLTTEVVEEEIPDEPLPPLRMSYEEFLDWADEDTLAEWVNGEVIMTSPASNKHQDIAGFLSSVLRPFVEIHRLGVIRIPPFQMKLPHSGREPDLIFIAGEHLHRLKDNRLEGPGDLVVEVVSPESRVRDMEVKLEEYEEAGVPEYWIIDPAGRRFEARVLEEGRYRLVFYGGEGVYRSRHLPEFWLRVEWLWQHPKPPVTEALWEVGGETYARALLEQLRERGFLS